MNYYRWLAWFIVTGLLISILANIFLARQIRSLYAERLLVQAFPAGLPQSPVMTCESGHFSSTILLFGDSRIVAWKFPPPPNTRLVNAAINGATTAQMRLRLPQLLDEFEPDVVVVQAGINDLKLVGLRPDLEADLVLHAATNLVAMAYACQSRNCKVLLLLTWPPGPPDWKHRPVWNRHIPEAVASLNDHLLGHSLTNHNFCVVDLLAESSLKPGPADYQDALHFQPEYYQRLTPELVRRLQKLCNQQ